jgi:hypothetical protein
LTVVVALVKMRGPSERWLIVVIGSGVVVEVEVEVVDDDD